MEGNIARARPVPVAVVTGGGRGLGRAIATRLAGDGAAVTLVGRDLRALEETRDAVEELGATALVVQADLTIEADITRMGERVMERFGRVDVLVNNAGIPGPIEPCWQVSTAEWSRTMAVNITAAFLTCRVLVPTMVEQRRGSVVNIGSLVARRPGLGRVAYASSKAALEGLTRALAVDVGPYGVRVNMVSPGPVQGERLEWAVRQMAAVRDTSTETVRKGFDDGSALRRVATAREVADTVAFLTSQAASGITGQDVSVNCGEL